MQHRQPPALPRLWLMTDERQGEALWRALERLPRGAGVIFRHRATPAGERRGLFDRVRRVARRRRLVLLLAGTPHQAAAWRADGAHGIFPHISARPMVRTAPVHDRRQIVAARKRADLLLLSPVFPTRSHPGAATLGRVRFASLARTAGLPVIALGGMNGRSVRSLPAHGWAGIDAWSE